jgi:hypothetical protein
MPIKTIRRLLNMSDPFDDFVEHTQRILSYCRTMQRDAKKHDYADIRNRSGACKRIIGRQVNKNNQQLISLWRKKHGQIRKLPHTAGKTKLHAMHEEMKDWLEELMGAIHAINNAAKEAEKVPKKIRKAAKKHQPQSLPNFTQMITAAEKPALKLHARAKEIRSLYIRVKAHNPVSHMPPQQRQQHRPQQRHPTQQRKPSMKRVA